MFVPLFNRAKTKKQSFLSLVISDDAVAAGEWEASSSGVRVVATSAPVEWQSDVPTGLTDASDVAFGNLGSSANTIKDVLLGLPSDWANDQSIANTKKHVLKELMQQLNVTSVGFVVTMEAIIASLRDKEGARCSGLLCVVGKKQLQAVVIDQGVATEMVSVGRSQQLTNDIVEACTQGKFAQLAPRLFVASLGAADTLLQEWQQQLHAFTFDPSLFVQLPKIELLSTKQIVGAVCSSGGKEVAKSLGILSTDTTGVNVGKQEEPESPEAGFGFAPVPTDAPHQTEQIPLINSDEKIDVEIEEPVTSASSGMFIKGVIGVGVVLLLLSLIVGGSIALARVNVAITRRVDTVSMDATLTLDSSVSASDPDSNILKASVRTTQVSDTAQADTTGTGQIGDKATGTVTIFNRTSSQKVLSAGTVLTLNPNVKYTLNADVTLPPEGGVDTDFSPSKASAQVTAAQIGAQSNADAGLQLTVGSYDPSAFVAKTETAMTGGSSRTIQVVSADDQQKLFNTLYASLKSKALDAFNAQANPNEHTIVSDKLDVSSKTFSADVGKEAQTLSLTMTVQATGIVYTNDDLTSFVTQKLGSQIAPGATLLPEKTTISIQNQQALVNGKTTIQAHIDASELLPVNATQTAKLLEGKTWSDAKNFLASQHSIDHFTLTATPSFVTLFIHTVPSASHISVTISPK
ncbi:hypothetical protein C5B42_03440 [Candidatus Cerribacteria bacterium 'Amazon FNV 2010 28 9']|uniref:Baseplate protein J-like domain-containing protein n=1 Tax=Candidatus Cerribacteria bacterium 'Amazon FNV 2010 28 9' TaxID=2081795 RepID=A0A317JR95_9BACT|nr:MAG: hypothetical protein C5B42_03440 [Candidatus Cerribacteria bacterium 'Amazon FNV 2010 28 9']